MKHPTLADSPYTLVSRWVLVCICLLAASLTPSVSWADPYLGAHTVTSASYKLPAQIYPDVRPDMETELWAGVWYPQDLGNGPYPMVMMLHGNHGTCGDLGFPRSDINSAYTSSGVCSNPAYPVVVPNHMGYAYLAERLASFGYIVVSINANRGVNKAPGLMDDGLLISTRGRLVLKHLELWESWSAVGAVPPSLHPDPDAFRGVVDLSEVGLFGHSRGGEALRALQQEYLAPGSPWPANIPSLVVRSIFEVAPTDQMTWGLTPVEVPWHVAIGTCDGDVSWGFGAGVFANTLDDTSESPPSPKSVWWIHGANHNFFNTEWQGQDNLAANCHEGYSDTPPLWVDGSGGSQHQQYALVTSVIPFMRQHVGVPDPAEYIHHRGFANPLYELDETLPFLSIRVDREYIDSPSDAVVTRLDDFQDIDQIGMHGVAFGGQDVTITEEAYQFNQTAVEHRARVSWDDGGLPSLDLLFTSGQTGIDLRNHSTLDFRVARSTSVLNADPTTSFSVQLLGPNGSVSDPIDTAAVVDLVGPFHMTVTHTARIPLEDFDFALDNIRGVRFAFDQTPTGEIWLDDVLFSRYGSGVLGFVPFPGDLTGPALPYPGAPPPPPTYGGTYASIGLGKGYWSDGSTDYVEEVEITTTEEITESALEPVLVIGSDRFSVSRDCDYTPGVGYCRIFQIEQPDYAHLVTGAPVSVTYDAPDAAQWLLGTFVP